MKRIHLCFALCIGCHVHGQTLARELLFRKTVETSYYSNDSSFFQSMDIAQQPMYQYAVHIENRSERLYLDSGIVSTIRYQYPLGHADPSVFYPEKVVVAPDSVRIFNASDSLLFSVFNIIYQKDALKGHEAIDDYIVRAYFQPLSKDMVNALSEAGYTISRNDTLAVLYANDSATYYSNAELAVSTYRYHPDGLTVHEELTLFDTLQPGILHPLITVSRDVEPLSGDSCVERVKLETYSDFTLVDHRTDSAAVRTEVRRAYTDKYMGTPYAVQVGNTDEIQLFNMDPGLLHGSRYVLMDVFGHILDANVAFDERSGRFTLHASLRYGVYILTPLSGDLPQFKILYFNR